MISTFGSLNQQLDDLLTRICMKIQVTKSEHDRAERSYSHVTSWLADTPAPSILYHSNPLIYPQGSLRIGTPTKPIGKNEFDVDLVCEFQLPWQNLTPQALLEATFKRLSENENFHKLLPAQLEPGRRCITLTYKNDFHIDVLPACSNRIGDHHGHIRVADKFKVGAWKDSNPKGYAAWFDARSADFQQTDFRTILNKAMVDEFPDHEEFDLKTPLQRSVQLLKRSRDVSFEKSTIPERKPISVVLTTLAGMKYSGETSVNTAVQALLADLNMKILTGQKIIVPNPTNPKEDFAEQWIKNPGAQVAFKEWATETHRRWEAINVARGPTLAKELKAMFGEEVTDSAIRAQVQRLEKSRAKDELGISTGSGLLTFGSSAAAIAVKKNTFFGSD